jgi:hypothetical protein
MRREFQDIADRLVMQERLDAVDEFERFLAAHGKVPDRSRLPHHRARHVIRVLIALALALHVAAIALLANFIIFNKMIHASF